MATKTGLASPEPGDGENSRRGKGKRNANGAGSIYQRKDGRWEAKVFVNTPDGLRKRVSVYGDTWEEAHSEKIRLQDQQRRGIPVAVSTVTVGEYMSYWLYDIAQAKVRRTTYSSYELLTRLYIVPGLGKRKLTALQAAHVRTWLNSVSKTCQCCAQGKDAARADKGKARCCAKQPAECCEQYPGTGTLRALLRVLRAALQDAIDEDLLARNVARQVSMPTGALRKVKPWTVEEARQFLEAAKHDRLYALWAVALAVGLRRGEALGLRWSDVDLNAGRINIGQALYRVSKELKLDQVKSESSAASVPLPEQLVVILRQHRRQQLADLRQSSTNEHGLVFTTRNGTPLEPRNVNRAFAALCRRANVRPIRLHDLRHSCATLLFSMGVDAATVQRILRHSSITVTTGTYVEVIEQVQRDAVAGMDTLFGFDTGTDDGSASG
ncbi:site-specific integrase [Haloechinothrix sp. YIM 98757]|uniref:Site-specific integrase n=1 Tax=Haloechinothrix aidingensis TaxID=2752311 RepID=A0A837ZUG3_9PSEU|nr:site-specific integrase [Haloechinothrix aidingensis]MBA0124236.1 site-specific integrase [Haloechinothrix aidingensis]